MRDEIFLATTADKKAVFFRGALGYPVRKVGGGIDETLEMLPQNPFLIPLRVAERKLRSELAKTTLTLGEYILASDTIGFTGENFSEPIGKPTDYFHAMAMAAQISEHGVINVAGTAVGIVGKEEIAVGGTVIETPGLKNFSDEKWKEYVKLAGERVLASATSIDLFSGGLSLAECKNVVFRFIDMTGRLESYGEIWLGVDPFDLNSRAMQEIGKAIHGANENMLESLAEQIK